MSAAPSTVLVTGAAGFIGFHTCARLLAAGHRVVGLDNFDPFYARALKDKNVRDLTSLAPDRFVMVERDLLNLAEQGVGVPGVSSVIHLAAKAGVRPSIAAPNAYLQANVTGTLNVLEYCRQENIKTLVFGSSSSVYGDDTPVPFREDAPANRPLSPYAASKRSAELFCANHAHLFGIRVCALRFFTVYGPRQRPDLAIHSFCKRMLAGGTIDLFGDGSTERDYTFVEDIVDGVMGGLAHVQQQRDGWMDIFNLGGSETTSLLRLVELLELNLGVKASRRFLPLQAGDVRRTFADTAKARAAFGFSPRVNMEQGIARFVTWFRTEAE